MTERDKAQKKKTTDKAPTTPATVPTPETGDNPLSAAPDATSAAQSTSVGDMAQAPRESSSIPPSEGHPLPTEAQKDVPQPSIEVSMSTNLALDAS